MGKTYMSREGYEKLKKELEYLQTEKKPAISARIGVAREHGDLKENFEYTAAKEALTQVMIRIRDITMKLSTAELIEDADIASDKVYIGATVLVTDEDTGEEEKYQLVCEDEVDALEGKISVESPIAKGLLGHKEGDIVEIQVPAGILKYKITDISR
ncbi:MAG: transcription elongation factor GreA [Elusimicrobiota bacterium]